MVTFLYDGVPGGRVKYWSHPSCEAGGGGECTFLCDGGGKVSAFLCDGGGEVSAFLCDGGGEVSAFLCDGRGEVSAFLRDGGGEVSAFLRDGGGEVSASPFCVTEGVNVPFCVTEGVNVSVVMSCSVLRSHTPTPSADPAAIAAPSAVVSGIEGRTEKQEHRPVETRAIASDIN